MRRVEVSLRSFCISLESAIRFIILVIQSLCIPSACCYVHFLHRNSARDMLHPMIRMLAALIIASPSFVKITLPIHFHTIMHTCVTTVAASRRSRFVFPYKYINC
ncbi:hypothetical protein BV25DRAFT_1821153 [Artomyces pyxidatus]|uniref:Uncharacterized protein n=1 Tax=Artomyces pyxidatus TaxID=48021 RepID=A0ACB8TBE8_9AGAM|nr:hypothetical protein BV25DRAFT_1821153 [Artomyces pyxidatus]